MKNGTAILNAFLKQVYLKFEEKFFTVNLADGDLEDCWTTIQFSEKTVLDVNFSWEDEPNLTLYGLIYDADNDVYNVNTKESYPIKISNTIGDKGNYLGNEFQGEIGINLFRIYSGCKLIKKTNSLDIASDFSARAIIIEELPDIHIVGMDKYGATKLIEIEDKYNKKYIIQKKSKERNRGVAKV